eukprot:GFUD01008893.1.p1 GENE.GFUD01008893.1~~GFUD01008893.1.p1  ORF type:complete len:317 (-),score=74.96 GFUD01008893.1:253-1176(-)
MATLRVVVLCILPLLIFPYFVFGDSLKGKVLVVTTPLSEPFHSLKSDHTERTGNDKYEGFIMDMLAELATRLECKFSVHLVPDNRYGAYDPDTKSWTGMIAEVLSGAADMAVGDMTITAKREEAVDFTVPFLHVGLTALYKKPMWARRWKAPVYSVEDLFKQNNVNFGVYCCGSSRAFFASSKGLLPTKINEKMEENPEVYTESNLEGVQRVLDGDGDYVYFMESSSAEYHVNNHCQLATVGKPLDSKGYGIALQQGSPYREEVNLALLQLREEGVLELIKSKWWNRNKDVCQNDWTQSLWNFLPSF